jgi:hypothetical protein
MTLTPAAPARAGQILDSLPLPIDQFHREPRCRVCRNDVVRRKVNDMLAAGASYAFIVRPRGGQRQTRPEGQGDGRLRPHCGRHFPVQNVAKSAYRDILERRAQENRVGFVEGIATALTPLAFFEVVMNMAFRSLVDDDAEVGVETGLRAAEKLQVVFDKRDPGDEIADMRRQVNMILDAVKTVVPEEYWGQIVARLDLEQHPEALDAETEDFDDEDVYDPTEFAEEDDEF